MRTLFDRVLYLSEERQYVVRVIKAASQSIVIASSIMSHVEKALFEEKGFLIQRTGCGGA